MTTALHNSYLQRLSKLKLKMTTCLNIFLIRVLVYACVWSNRVLILTLTSPTPLRALMASVLAASRGRCTTSCSMPQARSEEAT